MDEGQLLSYPDMLLRGAVPNVDFEHTYGPMNLWVLAGAYRSLGTAVAVERSLGLAYRVAVAVAVASICRARGAGRWHCASAAWLVLAFASPTELAAFAWFGGLACATGAVAVLAREKTTAGLIAGGALGGLAVSFRLDLLPAVAASALPLLPVRRSFIAWGAGVLLGASPLVWHAGRIGAQAAVQAWLLNPLRAAPGRHLPIPPNGLVNLLAFIAVLGGTSVLVRAAVVSRGRVDAAVALLAVGLLPQMFQRADLAHMAFVGCVILPLAILQSKPVVSRRFFPRKPGPLLIAMMATAALVRSVVTHFVCSPAALVVLGERSFPIVKAEHARALNVLLGKLDQRALDGERVFVGPRDLRRTYYADTFVYALLPRLLPGSYHTELNPGVANGARSRLATDLAKTDWLLLTDRYDDWNEPNASRDLGDPTASRLVETMYYPVATAPPYVLLERRSRHRPLSAPCGAALRTLDTPL
jgi:hypothetical protein